MTNFKVIVVGGGPVGLSVAHGLQQLYPGEVALIEAKKADVFTDPRSWVLTHGSERIFSGLGLWSHLSDFVHEINCVRVSDKGHFGRLTVNAQQVGLSSLGYVIEAGQLKKVLSTTVDVHRICPAKVVAISTQSNKKQLTLETESGLQTVNAELVLGCDGAHSSVRGLLGIGTKHRDYQQTALVGRVHLHRSHKNQAFERFTRSGPLALLPFGDRQMAFVWVVRHDQVESVKLGLSEQLQAEFGLSLGLFDNVELLGDFSLIQQLSDAVTQPGVVLLGDAAHQLHPVAGQGFNLGLRDVALFLEVLAQEGLSNCVERYALLCKEDQQFIAKMTDMAATLFTKELWPVALGRSIFLLGNDLLPVFMRGWLPKFTGQGYGQARLMRGESIG